MKRLLAIIAISALVIWVGAGCQNLKEVDFSITGFEAEWYEPPPLPPVVITNNPPAGSSWIPKLMQRGSD